MLFSRLAAEGVGRPVDRQGFPDGPWTPDLLAAAISAIDANRDGIELRTVQVWFQDNDNGINTDNIRWLARIFGCNDPQATSLWQAELRAAKERLAGERRSKRKTTTASTEQIPDSASPNRKPNSAPTEDTNVHADTNKRFGGIDLALRSEAMFAGPNSLNLPISIWGSLCVLWFVAFSLGVHSVTYSPSEGINKQVGLLWSPGWNIGEPIFLPMYLIIVSGLLNAWKQSDRPELLKIGKAHAVDSWTSKINSFWLSFWGILIICFIVIFLVQWAGVYLFPLIKNDPDVAMIDWMLIALFRPEILSTNAAIFVSFLGFMYTGMIYWFLFTGLLLLYMMAGDFSDICTHRQGGDDDNFKNTAFASGTKIMDGIFRCTILGILVALTIKLNAAYLISDAESLMGWLVHDASLSLGLRDDTWGWINGSPSPFFTSFLLLFLLCFVFGACLMLIKSALDAVIQNPREKRYARRVWFRMTLVVVILAIGYMLVGQFFGFSIVFVLCVTISLASLFWQTKPFDNNTHGT